MTDSPNLMLAKVSCYTVIKTHMQAFGGPNFAESAYLSSLTQMIWMSVEGNTGAQIGQVYNRRIFKMAFMDISYDVYYSSVEKYLISFLDIQCFTFILTAQLLQHSSSHDQDSYHDQCHSFLLTMLCYILLS